MNDLKTVERSTLNQENLKNLMIWHTVAKQLTCAQVPVMAILEEFRKMSGVRGRLAHRGSDPPKYGYRVKAEVDE